MENILKADDIAKGMKDKLKADIKALGKVVLASVKVGNDYSAESYLGSQARMAKELGVEYVLKAMDSSATQDELIKEIIKLNNDDNVTGIIVNKPFPKGWNETKIFSCIDLRKDIEGMNPCDIGLLMMAKYAFISPTVLSVLEFLKSEPAYKVLGGTITGKEVTIVGASLLIGKPLAVILADMFATVTLTHVGTYDAGRLAYHVGNADIVISAVGKPGLVKGEWIKNNAIVIDVGTGVKDGKICGDIEFDAACERAALITPVPGGVGKLTTLFLFENLVKAGQFRDYEKQK